MKCVKRFCLLLPLEDRSKGLAMPNWLTGRMRCIDRSGLRKTGGTRIRPMFRLLALSLFIAGLACSPAFSQSEILPQDHTVDFTRISVPRHKSRTFRLRTEFDTAVVASPEIADVLAVSDRVIYVQGKKPGTTNISIFDKTKNLIGVIDIEVTIDTDNLAQKIHSSTSSPDIRVTSSNDQVVLSGMARNAPDADRAVSIAKSLAPDVPVVNLMKIAPAQQVMLKVRFLEASRENGRDVGFNWFASNGDGRGVVTGLGDFSVRNPAGAPGISLFEAVGTFAGTASSAPFGVALANLANGGMNVDVLISALEAKGLARRLAEPDLVALSGDKASFLAGGEIPVPVVQPSSTGSTLTVEYKPFGVQLTFVPTVLADGIINLRLTPSVSQLDFTNAIRNEGFLIPALSKREARTTIELRDGQSFAIAGLLQREGLRNISQVPWLGSVPVLGALFRSSAYQQSETDLVVIVTPHLVAPAAPGQRLATPFDDRLPSNDRDFFLIGQTEVEKDYSEFVTSGKGVEGPYGHMIFLDQH
jgi:pilus assembly protein CpaC